MNEKNTIIMKAPQEKDISTLKKAFHVGLIDKEKTTASNRIDKNKKKKHVKKDEKKKNVKGKGGRKKQWWERKAYDFSRY